MSQVPQAKGATHMYVTFDASFISKYVGGWIEPCAKRVPLAVDHLLFLPVCVWSRWHVPVLCVYFPVVGALVYTP